MIQRPQTIFLLLAGIATALMIAWPTVSFDLESVKDVDLDRLQGLSAQVDVDAYGAKASIEIPEQESQNEVKSVLDEKLEPVEVPLYLGYAVLALLSVMTIFLFKKRGLQLSLTGFNLFLHILMVVGIAVVSNMVPDMINERMITEIKSVEPDVDTTQLQDSLKFSTHYGNGFYAGCGAVLMLMLAWFFIRRDKKLVASLDRIR